MGSRTQLFLYAATIFLASAVLLVLEITAGRLIAPYVGVSLYSWTSIIGVILAGLSLGNWLGGLWADRGGGPRAAGLALALAGLASLAVLLVLTLVAPVIQRSDFNLLGASLLFVLSLFFVPSVLLGVVTPLLTTLALKLDPRAVYVVGRMHALAIPYHLTTLEYAQLVKRRLTRQGIYLLNVVDAYPDPHLVKSLIATLRQEFRYVHAWLETRPSEAVRMTFVISATDQGEPPAELISQRGFERKWWRATEYLLANGAPLEALPILTDDHVPIERLVSRLLITELGH